MMKFTEAELIELESAAGLNDAWKNGYCPKTTLRRLIDHARGSGVVEGVPPMPNWRLVRKIITDSNRQSLMGCFALGGRVEIFQREPLSEPSSNSEPNV